MNDRLIFLLRHLSCTSLLDLHIGDASQYAPIERKLQLQLNGQLYGIQRELLQLQSCSWALIEQRDASRTVPLVQTHTILLRNFSADFDCAQTEQLLSNARSTGAFYLLCSHDYGRRRNASHGQSYNMTASPFGLQPPLLMLPDDNQTLALWSIADL